MTISAGAGGTSLIGVTLGAGATQGTPSEVSRQALDAVTALPFTGASHLLTLLAIGLLTVLAGVMMMTMARRHGGESSPPSAPTPV